MQLSEFEVENLFGRYHHRIKFPVSKPDQPQPSLVILHGPNGVGKTTVLRMIDGFLRLDFNVFRETPFKVAALRFTTGSCIEVRPVVKGKRKTAIKVSFGDKEVCLHPTRSGPLTEKELPAVEEFREKFFHARESLVFEFIDTSRMVRQRPPDEEVVYARALEEYVMLRERQAVNPKALAPPERVSLVDRVARFINEAQVNHRRFFATSETDLFARIIQKLTQAHETRDLSTLLGRLKAIGEQDARFKKLGIEVDNWDFNNIEALVSQVAKGEAKEQALAALGAFVEVLESRTTERSLLADRLETFLRVMADFFHDKVVSISPKSGLVIRTLPPERRTLKEQQLSTGEFHLLYLMVAALVTQRGGTIIAIDEPEMSMHLAWQRKLIRALFECASKAEPQFIFATHSPDVAADFPQALVEMGS